MGANCSNITYPDPNLTAYVYQYLGPRCVANSVAIPTTVVYCLILILGIFGNTCTCLVVARKKNMQTATNFYIVSLAVSDMILLIFGLPFELQGTLGTTYPYELPLFICKGRAYITEVTSYASILTITAFSVERWLAICFPLKIQVFSKSSRAFHVIVGIWFAATLSALPVVWFVTVNKLLQPTMSAGTHNQSYSQTSAEYSGQSSSYIDENGHLEHTEFCALDFYDMPAQSAVINWSFWAFFCVPLAIICGLYVCIGVKLKLTIRQLRQSDTHKLEQRTVQSRKTVLRMLVAVVVAFFVCWLPFHAQRLMTIYFSTTNMSQAAQELFSFTFYFSGYFYYANSAVNPILYSILSRKFRRAFILALCPECVASRLGVFSTSLDKTRSVMSRHLVIRHAAQSSPGASSLHVNGNRKYVPPARSYDCYLDRNHGSITDLRAPVERYVQMSSSVSKLQALFSTGKRKERVCQKPRCYPTIQLHSLPSTPPKIVLENGSSCSGPGACKPFLP